MRNGIIALGVLFKDGWGEGLMKLVAIIAIIFGFVIVMLTPFWFGELNRRAIFFIARVEEEDDSVKIWWTFYWLTLAAALIWCWNDVRYLIDYLLE